MLKTSSMLTVRSAAPLFLIPIKKPSRLGEIHPSRSEVANAQRNRELFFIVSSSFFRSHRSCEKCALPFIFGRPWWRRGEFFLEADCGLFNDGVDDGPRGLAPSRFEIRDPSKRFDRGL